MVFFYACNYKLFGHTDVFTKVYFLVIATKFVRINTYRVFSFMQFFERLYGGDDSKDEALDFAFWCAGGGELHFQVQEMPKVDVEMR